MKKTVNISVVIVSWNAKKFLIDCLQSLLLQEISKTMEIIVVDNASTDGSPEVVIEQFPSVILIQNDKNLGFSKANNIGINHSTGDYIYLINSDIKVLNDCITKLYHFMEENPSIGIVGPKILNSDLSLQSSCRRFPSLWNNFCPAVGLNRLFPALKIFSGEHMFYFPHDKIRKVDVLVGCFLMIRRKTLEQVGYLDEQFFIYMPKMLICANAFGMLAGKLYFTPIHKQFITKEEVPPTPPLDFPWSKKNLYYNTGLNIIVRWPN